MKEKNWFELSLVISKYEVPFQGKEEGEEGEDQE